MGKNLATLDEFKTYKVINSTESDDIIESLLSRVSAFIKTYCGKTFVDYASVAKTEYFDAVGTEVVHLDEYPIISVDSVQTSLDGGKTYGTALTVYDDYFVNEEISAISTAYAGFVLTTASSVSKGTSSRSLKVIYKAGYLKLPEELRQATLDLVEYYKENEYTPRQDFEGFKIENLGFRTGDSTNLPSHIKRVLDMYKEL